MFAVFTVGPMRIIYVDDQYQYGLTYLCFYVAADGICGSPMIDVIGRDTHMSDVIKEKLMTTVAKMGLSPNQFVDIAGQGRNKEELLAINKYIHHR